MIGFRGSWERRSVRLEAGRHARVAMFAYYAGNDNTEITTEMLGNCACAIPAWMKAISLVASVL